MEERDNRFARGMVTGILCSFVIVAIVLGTTYYFFISNIRKETVSSTTSFSYEQVVEKLKLIKGRLDQGFLYEEDEAAMAEGIYKGFVDSLGDPYTVYYTAEEYSDMLETSSGQYKGIGVQISQDPSTNLITIIQVFKESGAEAAGLQSGDIIYKVDGEDITSEDINSVVSKIKGDDGTTVNVEVYRPELEDYVSFDVERGDVSVETVEWSMLEDGIGYISIMEFDEVTYNQFAEAIEDLKSQGMTGLVLDLRDNPGGLLDSVVKIADDLLPEGVIVSTKNKNGEGSEETSDEEMTFDGSLVILVNGNSASASEVLTGAIKDYERGVIVGTQTFGKGIVQTILPLGDGTALKMTVSNYYSPNGINIHGVGIEPDIIVEAEDGETDHQLERALEALKESMSVEEALEPAA